MSRLESALRFYQIKVTDYLTTQKYSQEKFGAPDYFTLKTQEMKMNIQ